jgi:hypothetical protein
MASLAHYALPGIIVLASVGAFLMCLAVIRYGFAPLEEDPDAARRLFLTRVAHAAAAVCFAGAALLAVAAWSARGAPAAAAARGTDAGALGELPARLGEQAREIARLTEALHRLPREVEERLAAAESRPRGRQAGQPATARGEPAAERGPSGLERGQPAAERGQPTAQSRRAATEIRKPAAVPRPAPADGEEAYTLPAGAAARTVTATVEGVRVQVDMHPLKEHETAYVVRLTGAGRRPLSGAEVSIQGQTADGRPVQTTLAPAGEPGVLRGRLPNIAQDLRLRVAGPGTRFEVSLAGETRW